MNTCAVFNIVFLCDNGGVFSIISNYIDTLSFSSVSLRSSDIYKLNFNMCYVYILLLKNLFTFYRISKAFFNTTTAYNYFIKRNICTN